MGSPATTEVAAGLPCLSAAVRFVCGFSRDGGDRTSAPLRWLARHSQEIILIRLVIAATHGGNVRPPARLIYCLERVLAPLATPLPLVSVGQSALQLRQPCVRFRRCDPLREQLGGGGTLGIAAPREEKPPGDGPPSFARLGAAVNEANTGRRSDQIAWLLRPCRLPGR